MILSPLHTMVLFDDYTIRFHPTPHNSHQSMSYNRCEDVTIPSSRDTFHITSKFSHIFYKSFHTYHRSSSLCVLTKAYISYSKMYSIYYKNQFLNHQFTSLPHHPKHPKPPKPPKKLKTSPKTIHHNI